MCHNTKGISMVSGRTLLYTQAYQGLRLADTPEELSNMSMPFVMPISLVVTFLLQADSFTISAGPPEGQSKLHERTVRQTCFSLPAEHEAMQAVQPGSTQGRLSAQSWKGMGRMRSMRTCRGRRGGVCAPHPARLPGRQQQ